MAVACYYDHYVLIDLESWFLGFIDNNRKLKNNFILKSISKKIDTPYFGCGKKFGPPSKMKYLICMYLEKLKESYCCFSNNCNCKYVTRKSYKSYFKKPNNYPLHDHIQDIPQRNHNDEIYINKELKSKMILYHNTEIIFPPVCYYQICDIWKFKFPSVMHDYFDIIIIDPPWENKSVKRSTFYHTQSSIIDNLKKLNINQLLKKSSGFVLIWVTNNENYQQSVLNTIIPRWQLLPIGCFVYVKITSKGEPIFDVDSSHRQPYEYCIVCCANLNCQISPICRVSQLPVLKYIFMVQPTIHSMKPPLYDFLSRWCPGNIEKILELFARYPSPYTFSFGNQLIQLFEVLI